MQSSALEVQIERVLQEMKKMNSTVLDAELREHLLLLHTLQLSKMEQAVDQKVQGLAAWSENADALMKAGFQVETSASNVNDVAGRVEDQMKNIETAMLDLRKNREEELRERQLLLDKRETQLHQVQLVDKIVDCVV